jgi:DNA-binding PadR family transcriptional regulator
MERKLLLLGLLRRGDMHGYEINGIVEHHLDSGLDLTRSSAYRLLSVMEGDGWISSRRERKGNRPARTVYRITPRGEAAFRDLLRISLGTYTPPTVNRNLGFAFMGELDPAEAAGLLKVRLESAMSRLTTMQNIPDRHSGFDALLRLERAILMDEIRWTENMVRELEVE